MVFSEKHVKRIYVKNLFGNQDFTYNIELNLDKRISFITSYNGYGKTTILKMINSIFEFNPIIFEETSFESFLIEMVSGKTFEVVKDKNDKEHRKCLISVSGIKTIPFTDEDLIFDPFFISSNIEFDDNDSSKPILDRMLRYQTTKEHNLLSDKEWEKIRFFVFRMKHKIQFEGFRVDNQICEKIEQIPNIHRIEFITHSLNVIFLDTKRLEKDNRSEYIGMFRETHVIDYYCNLMAKRLQEAEKKYNESARKNTDKFITEIVKNLLEPQKYSDDELFVEKELTQMYQNSNSKDVIQQTREEIFNKVDQIKKMINPYMELNLIDSSIYSLIYHIGEGLRLFPTYKYLGVSLVFLNMTLDIYINNLKQDLKVYDEILSSSQMLKEFMSTKLRNKIIMLDKEAGFRIRTNYSNDFLPLSKLSSGEQQMFVLYYRLLFETPIGSLILLDEPEISIHIAWQQQLMDELKIIAQKKNLDFIISTHSVNIIDGNWDTVIDLSEKDVENDAL